MNFEIGWIAIDSIFFPRLKIPNELKAFIIYTRNQYRKEYCSCQQRVFSSFKDLIKELFAKRRITSVAIYIN